LKSVYGEEEILGLFTFLEKDYNSVTCSIYKDEDHVDENVIRFY